MKLKTILIAFLIATRLFVFGQKDSLLKIYNISIDSMGNLKWISYSIENAGDFSVDIEQLKGDKWILVGGYSSCSLSEWIPTTKIREDSLRVKFHKGLNIYRIIASSGHSKIISPEIQLISHTANDDKSSPWIVGNEILLDKKEYFEIINQNGETIIKGESEIINISALQKGSYFLYRKNSTVIFMK